jgi:biotin transport system substrate-specific component
LSNKKSTFTHKFLDYRFKSSDFGPSKAKLGDSRGVLMSAISVTPRVLVETVRIAWVRDVALVLASVGFIAGMAQISIPLPFSPVPLTGQTFAVLLSVASLGAWRGLTSTSIYFGLAVAGLPVLAPTVEGGHVTGVAVFSMASLGYVLGFIVAAVVVGRLAEAGFTHTSLKTFAAMFAGNVAIYVVGLIVLKANTGADWLTTFQWGLFPFLIGDAIKMILAAGLLPATWKFLELIGHKN